MGGALMCVAGYWQATGHVVRPYIYWLIGIVGFGYASYQTWRDEYLRVFTEDLFEAEFVRAVGVIYISQRGDAPFMNVQVLVRLHNRRHDPTTVLVREFYGVPKSGPDNGFDRTRVWEAGVEVQLMENQDKFEMLSTSSAEVVFHNRRYNVNVADYADDANPLIVLELGETFGSHRKFTERLRVRQESSP